MTRYNRTTGSRYVLTYEPGQYIVTATFASGLATEWTFATEWQAKAWINCHASAKRA